MKRNKEDQYRIKIIQENHYDKIEQRILDREISIHNLKYKEVYIQRKYGYGFWFMAAIATRRARKAMVQAGIAAAKLKTLIGKDFVCCVNVEDKAY